MMRDSGPGPRGPPTQSGYGGGAPGGGGGVRGRGPKRYSANRPNEGPQQVCIEILEMLT